MPLCSRRNKASPSREGSKDRPVRNSDNMPDRKKAMP